MLAPCDQGHHWCIPCLSALFEQSLIDETLFPPRCCQAELAPSMVSEHLPEDFSRRFTERQIETSTSDRTYCRKCTRFLLPEHITGQIGTCTECATKTCTICKEAAHEGFCPADPAVEETKRLAVENGWRECPSCRNIIELTHGCNHMRFVPEPLSPFNSN